MKIRPAETNDLSKVLPVAETIAALRARAEKAEKYSKLWERTSGDNLDAALRNATRAEAAEEDVRQLTEAARENEGIIERGRAAEAKLSLSMQFWRQAMSDHPDLVRALGDLAIRLEKEDPVNTWGEHGKAYAADLIRKVLREHAAPGPVDGLLPNKENK